MRFDRSDCLLGIIVIHILLKDWVVYVWNSMTTHETYFPDAVWGNIFSYFHSSYKKPSHFVAWKQAKTINPGDDYMNDYCNIYVPDLNIWYDVRTGYIHEHIGNIRYNYPLPYDQSHEEEIGDQELKKDFLHEELRDFIEESNDINVRLLPLIVECNRL